MLDVLRNVQKSFCCDTKLVRMRRKFSTEKNKCLKMEDQSECDVLANERISLLIQMRVWEYYYMKV